MTTPAPRPESDDRRVVPVRLGQLGVHDARRHLHLLGVLHLRLRRRPRARYRTVVARRRRERARDRRARAPGGDAGRPGRPPAVPDRVLARLRGGHGGPDVRPPGAAERGRTGPHAFRRRQRRVRDRPGLLQRISPEHRRAGAHRAHLGLRMEPRLCGRARRPGGRSRGLRLRPADVRDTDRRGIQPAGHQPAGRGLVPPVRGAGVRAASGSRRIRAWRRERRRRLPGHRGHGAPPAASTGRCSCSCWRGCSTTTAW